MKKEDPTRDDYDFAQLSLSVCAYAISVIIDQKKIEIE